MARARSPLNRPLVALTILFAVVAAVAGITLGVTTLLGVTFQGTGEAQPAGGSQTAQASPSPGGLGPLAICVQAVGADLELDESPQAAALQAETKSTVDAALLEVAKHPYWESSPYGRAAPVVDIGCPSGPPPLEDEVYRSSVITSGQRVVELSPYDLFVFILPPQDLEELMKYGTPRTAPQEQLCEYDVCFAGNDAVYVRADEIQDPAFLAWLLEDGIAFEPLRALGPQRWAGFQGVE